MDHSRRWRLSVLALLSAMALSAAEPAAWEAQWADLPEYLGILRSKPKFKTPPRLISGEPPESPPFLAPGVTRVLKVAIAIDEQGGVAAVRVISSEDPRIDASAIAAILQWKFTPAHGDSGPCKSVVRMPLEFVGPLPAEEGAIQVSLGPFQYDAKSYGMHASVQMTGKAASDIRAGRVAVASAIDDTGAELAGPWTTNFTATSAGGIRADQGSASVLDISLVKPAARATHLRTLTGSIELVIPGLDPDATTNFDHLGARLGQPLTSPALAAMGITIIVLDRDLCTRMFADSPALGAVQDFLANSRTKRLRTWVNGTDINRMTGNDLAVAIHDPNERLAGWEFQSVYGETLPYDSKGWAHFRLSYDKLFSFYSLGEKPSDAIKLVCWLITPKSLVAVPLFKTDLPITAAQ